MNRNETGAEPFDAGIVLVARRLVDPALAAVLRVYGNNGHTIRLGATITAAFTNPVVDEDADGWIGILAPLASTTFFGCTGLVVNERGHARVRPQLPLNSIQITAVADRDVRGQP